MYSEEIRSRVSDPKLNVRQQFGSEHQIGWVNIQNSEKMAFYSRSIILIVLCITVGFLNKSKAQTVLNNNYTIELISSSPKLAIGTNPHWCKETQSLYYVDLLGSFCKILRYCPADDKVYCASIRGISTVTFFAPIEGSPTEFVCGTKHVIFIVQWNGISKLAFPVRIAFAVNKYAEFETNLSNDVKTDPFCRLFAGTKRIQTCNKLDIPMYANLFQLSVGQRALTLNKTKTIRFSNGLAWSEKFNKFYYHDSRVLNIKEDDYCPHTGNISKFQRLVLKEHDFELGFSFRFIQ